MRMQEIIAFFVHDLKGKGHLWRNLILGYTKGYVRHLFQIVLERLDFTDFQRIDKNQSSTEQVFIELHINPVIQPFQPNDMKLYDKISLRAFCLYFDKHWVTFSTKIKELQLILNKKLYFNILDNFKTQDKEFNQYQCIKKTHIRCQPWNQRQ